MEFIKNQNWRYATKNFNSSKKVSCENLETIKKAIQLSASSYGLQPYKVLIIEDIDIRKKLKSVSWNQSQITDASHLIVFCNYTPFEPSNIDLYIELTAKTKNVDLDQLEGYGSFMKTKIGEKTEEEQFNWSKQQTYIAMANLLSICAELKVDACPMEGFESLKYNEILGLNKKGLNASVIVPIGYRAEADNTQHFPKVRKPMELLFESI